MDNLKIPILEIQEWCLVQTHTYKFMLVVKTKLVLDAVPYREDGH